MDLDTNIPLPMKDNCKNVEKKGIQIQNVNLHVINVEKLDTLQKPFVEAKMVIKFLNLSQVVIVLNS